MSLLLLLVGASGVVVPVIPGLPSSSAATSDPQGSIRRLGLTSVATTTKPGSQARRS